MAKIDRIVQILETRIARGDYAMTLFPTEHALADEMNAGRMTARRAILRLVEKELLYRDSSGRLAVTAQRSSQRPLQIGFVTGTLSTTAVSWQQAAEQTVRALGGHMRVVTYFHWDDPVLLEATGSFDGVFLFPPAEILPAQLAKRLLGSRARIVTLSADYSPVGLRSVDTVPAESVETLLDHLAALGHRQIAAFNTQPLVPAIEERLAQWQGWLAVRKYAGELINEPEPSYGNPMQRAYRVAQARLANGEGLGGTAVLCTTLPATLGLMRAANEHGLTVGRDISICTVNDEGLGPFLSPTLTSTAMSDPHPLLRECLDWMAGGEWAGPLLKRSANVELFVGRSTGPAPEISLGQQKSVRLKTSPTNPASNSRQNAKNQTSTPSLK